jgi:osmotically-inducible protein OsmY
VTLGGDVEELHQKEEAETIASKILGVRGLTNNIEIKHNVRPSDVTRQILRTFQNMAVHHVQDIQVEINGSKVILSGIVRAWIEKAEAEQAAYDVPGITEVENRLEVTPLLEGKEKPPVIV